MKIKKIIATICLCLSIVVLTSCSGINLKDMPQTNETVYGNGGVSVTKGEYVYFVNSYTSYSGLNKNDNNTGKVKTGAIYRTKLKNGKVEYNDNDEVENYEMVVSKIAGYEFTNLYIFDDYIYYATPNMNYSKAGTLNTKAVDFCRTKLNGTGTEIIYTANDYDDNSEYAVYKIGGNIYLVVKECDKLVKVEIAKRIKSAVTLAKNITGAKLPQISTYTYAENVGTIGTQGYVYYTRDFNAEQDNAYDTSSISGNILGRVAITDGAKVERQSAEIKYELKALTNNNIFVTKNVDIYAIDKTFPIDENTTGIADIKMTNSVDSLSISNFYVLKNSTGYCYNKDGATYYKNALQTYGVETKLSDSELTIVNDDSNYVYYQKDNGIYRISLTPKYCNEKEFDLDDATATINGEAKQAGDKISAFTFISQDEYLALNAYDKQQFMNVGAELIIDDSKLDSKYIDYTQDGEIYYFSTYTGDEHSQVYLKRVCVNEANRAKNIDGDTEEVIEPTTFNEFNLGFNSELLCVLEKEHKAK